MHDSHRYAPYYRGEEMKGGQIADLNDTDDLNTLNIKLFPIYPSPPSVKAWHVPLFTVRYQTFMDENWDLTMQRVCLT